MKLSGKFSYRRSNQRVLAFHTDIRELEPHQREFTGSSSEDEKLVMFSIFSSSFFRKLQRVWYADSSHTFLGSLHLVRVPPLRDVRGDELGLLLYPP